MIRIHGFRFQDTFILLLLEIIDFYYMELRISQVAIIKNTPVQFLKDDIDQSDACTRTVYECPCYYYHKFGGCKSNINCNTSIPNKYVNIGHISYYNCVLRIVYRIRIL